MNNPRKNKVLLFISIWLFISIFFKVKAQQLPDYLENTVWYTEEGLKLTFKDSTMNFLSLIYRSWHGSEDISIKMENSVLYSSRQVETPDTSYIITLKISEVNYLLDSMILKFYLQKISDTLEDRNILKYYYFDKFKDSTLVFYNSETYKNRKHSYELKYFNGVDSLGNVTFNTHSIVEIRDSFYIDGIHRGKLSDSKFNRLKIYLADSLISKFTFYKNEFGPDDGGCKYHYSFETRNIKRQHVQNCRNEPHEPYLSKIPSFFTDDSAWVSNDMKFYGYDINNNVPLNKQIVFYKYEKNKRFIACSGNAELKKTVKNHRQSRFIYQLIVDSIHDNPKRLSTYPVLDTIYFVSSYKIQGIDSKGFILNATEIYNGPPVVYLKAKYKWKTYFYELIDTFSLDTNYIFLFNKIYYGLAGGYPKKGWGYNKNYQSELNSKISREILKLKGKYYY